MAKSEGIRLIANNKKAFHDYFIDEKFEAGTEVKIIVTPEIDMCFSYF